MDSRQTGSYAVDAAKPPSRYTPSLGSHGFSSLFRLFGERCLCTLGRLRSRAAEIPIGWEVTIDLVRKVAGVQGDECGPDPVQWYLKEFGQYPRLSRLFISAGKAWCDPSRTSQ